MYYNIEGCLAVLIHRIRIPQEIIKGESSPNQNMFIFSQDVIQVL